MQTQQARRKYSTGICVAAAAGHSLKTGKSHGPQVLGALVEAKRMLENAETPGAEGHKVEELPGVPRDDEWLLWGCSPLLGGERGGIHDD